jgi:hypothetical protein
VRDGGGWAGPHRLVTRCLLCWRRRRRHRRQGSGRRRRRRRCRAAGADWADPPPPALPAGRREANAPAAGRRRKLSTRPPSPQTHPLGPLGPPRARRCGPGQRAGSGRGATELRWRCRARRPAKPDRLFELFEPHYEGWRESGRGSSNIELRSGAPLIIRGGR